ncbi:GAF and ANTAR domain-containing protein [Microlunatus speluncae]|uniref:GAF and ANTAR domain-containing protein n=1 Tax=Microlunatus speluncae TaxID=2594267 RepID=UPI001FE8F4E0|nr:GAF and ANTAR domain-containing protein [Microlunatus speluncae]
MTAVNPIIIPLQEFGRLSTSVHEATTIEETVEAVAGFAVGSLGCTAAAILLGKKAAQLELAASTDDTFGKIVAADPSRGPYRDAFGSDTAVIIDNLPAETRWPDWPPVADPGHGLRSLLVLRFKVADHPAGVLVAGHPEPAAFDVDEEAIAHIVTRHASIAVAVARQQESLAEAVDARKLVGQAMGILMERYGIDDVKAFGVLRRYSQQSNTKLRTIALELIVTRTLPGLPAAGGGSRVYPRPQP